MNVSDSGQRATNRVSKPRGYYDSKPLPAKPKPKKTLRDHRGGRPARVVL